MRIFIKNICEEVYLSVKLNEWTSYRKSLQKVTQASYRLTTNCDNLFPRYLQEVARTSYNKLQEKVISC